MLHYCGNVTYSAGTRTSLDLRQLPKFVDNKIAYIRSVIVDLTVPLTSAASSDAIGQKAWAALADTVVLCDNTRRPFGCEKPLRSTALRAFQMALNLQGPVDPAAIAANSNTTNTLRGLLVLPFTLPTLADTRAVRQPVARLEGGRLDIDWSAATIYGTGQTVGTVVARVYVEYEPGDALVMCPELVLRHFSPTRFVQDSVRIDGKPAFFGFGSLLKAGVIGATDYTYVTVDGRGVKVNRSNIDAPAMLYNGVTLQKGDADDSQIALPSSGSGDLIPLVAHPWDQPLSKIPIEGEVSVTLEAGAGNPALTDEEYLLAVVTPRDPQRWMASVAAGGLATVAQMTASLQRAPNAKGFMGMVAPGTPEYPYLPVTLYNLQ